MEKEWPTVLFGDAKCRGIQTTRSSGQPLDSEKEWSEKLEDGSLDLLDGCRQEFVKSTDNNMHMSQNLDTAQEELVSVKRGHDKERFCPLAMHSTLGAQLLDALRSQLNTQKTLARKSTARDGLLNLLRQCRAQHTEISRKLRNTLLINSTLSIDLDKERAARAAAENALTELADKNIGLTEQIKMLSSPEPVPGLPLNKPDHLILDTAIFLPRRTISKARSQQFPVSNIFKPSESVFECHTDINVLSGPICWTTEFRQFAPPNKVIAMQEELIATKECLVLAEQRCDAFSTKISCLQTNFNVCVDECSRALDNERKLRHEIEKRLYDLTKRSRVTRDLNSESENDSSAIDNQFVRV